MVAVDELDRRRGQLETWLATCEPEISGLSLSPFRPASSGFSNITLFTELSARGPDGPIRKPLVLRAQSAGGGLFPDYDLRLQYDVMAALGATPLPVPEVSWFVDDPEVLGAPCYLMERVHGEVASGFRPGFHGHGLFFDASVGRRRTMWFEAVDAMAALHRLRLEELALPAALDRRLTAEQSVIRVLDLLETQMTRAGVEAATLYEAVGRLRDRVPPDPGVALCWGDARPGNIVYSEDRVAAVLDWELAYIGPPAGDLAYFLLVDEVVAELNDVPRLPGLPDAAATIDRYERRVGAPVTGLEFHTALQALRMAAMLALTVALSPPQLTFPPNYLTDNVAMRRLAELIG
jgi:aminoglycoside phosphotransferase (APT) family kinase protein